MISAVDEQTTSAIFMVRPESFGSNPQTIESNSFQKQSATSGDLLVAAQHELDTLVAALTDHGVRVVCFNGRAGRDIPDECFPNNWISMHGDGTVVLYPMMAENRRRERRADIVAALSDAQGYEISQQIDLSHHENSGRYLEGTGSVVLDRVNKVAFAGMSPRTHHKVLDEFETRLGYETIRFNASSRDGIAIYHTNVMLSIGRNFSTICSEAITESKIRNAVIGQLEKSGREIIELSLEQMHAFAGNMLELRGSDSALIVMSTTALDALTVQQKKRLEAHGRLVSVPLPTIETYGGGSARCLMAEIFLPAC